MVDAAHAVMVGSLNRQKHELTTDVWILQAAESLIDRAETLLRAHTEAGPDVLAYVVNRRAVLAWTRHPLGHPDGDPDLCRALMRESLELFEAAGQAHVPLAINARQFLELHEQSSHGEPSETVGEDGPPRVPLPPSGGSGAHRMSEYSWRDAVALTRAVPPDARLVYGLLGATSYHLGGQAAPSSAFLALAFAAALRSMGLECRLLPTRLQVARGEEDPLDLPGWQQQPMALPDGEVRGHVTIWCEEAGRLVDPALLLGQSLFAPGAAERKIFQTPVVLPAPGLETLLNVRLSTHREGHLLTYEFRPDWEDRLGDGVAHLDRMAVADFAQQLATSAALAANIT
ncbi:hypothetical protein [Streptomyces sp. bgisy130]|uniref:hypothetical protein n=1 Tax=Streptomyces sp. bgisy130 TaxID=3413788 RepID=UPI003F4A477E